MPSTEPTTDTQDRHLRDASPRSVYPAYVNRWAILVGISKYQHEQLNLQFADRDAEELYKLLQTPSGGGFEANKIMKLVNEEATTARVQRALRSFLQPAKREDIVLLYFACHGGPDRRNNPYLLTYDTDPNDISGTALPMREIRLSLKENLDAERVVIIADTCHSAAVAADINLRGTTNEAEVINTYLEEISKAKGGVAVLTSAQASETAQESKQWGDGHGVFTHFLLEGMRGAAAKDGIVRVQQLFEYVRTRVKEATKDQQHPVIGPDVFDPMLPMAITGGVNAQEHYQLGRHLYELGWLLDDAKRFQAAARQFQAAIWLSQMAKTPLPQAELGLGQALLAAEDCDGAIQVFSRLLERNPAEAPSATLFYLGMAQAKRRNFSAAVPAFEQFVIQNPQHESAAFACAYIAALKTGDIGTKRALLIGINQYADQNISPLQGCLNDVELMKTMLKQRGFQENNIIVLADKEATRSNILYHFAQLSQNTSVDDTVVIHFSGWGMGHKGPQMFVYDSKLDNNVAGHGITPVELHQILNQIPAYDKILVFDAKSIKEFAEYAKTYGAYNLLLATNPDELPFEEAFLRGKDYVRAGVLSRTLEEALAAFDRQEITYQTLLGSVIQRIRTKGFDQTPLFIGQPDQSVFAHEEIYLHLFAFAQRQTYEAFTLGDLKKRYARLGRQITAPFPKAHYSFGLAFLEKGDYVTAIKVLETAQQQSTSHNPDIILALGKAHLGVQQYVEALRCFQQYAIMAPAEVHGSAQTMIELTQRLIQGQPHALLIGINNYSNPDIRPVRGAVNDVLAFKEVLLAHCGFQPANVKVLLDHQATRATILSEFKQLIEIARCEPALFYFAGNGSIASKDEPTIVSADGRQTGVYDITLIELVELAAHLPNLVVIVDAGWTSSIKEGSASRMITNDKRQRPSNREFGLSRDLTKLNLQIGGLNIYSNSIQSVTLNVPSTVEKKLAKPNSENTKEIYGRLTHSLVQRLWQANIAELTYAQWTETTEAFVQGHHQDEPIFHNRAVETAILQLTQEIENMPVKATIDLLRRLIEQRQQQNDPYPEGRLNLGIAYAAINDYDKSIEHLERAVALYSDPSIMARELEKDPTANLHYDEARYQLGRILFTSERDFSRAVSELTVATRLDPENVRAFYYLGQAIREMVERETLAKAEEALQTYLVKGSPLGHEAEVREFLGSRKKPEATR